MKQLADQAGTIDPDMLENYRKQLISQIQRLHRFISPTIRKSGAEDYASRDPFVGLVQTNMGKTAHAIGVPAMANVANDWQQFGDARPALGVLSHRLVLSMEGSKTRVCRVFRHRRLQLCGASAQVHDCHYGGLGRGKRLRPGRCQLQIVARNPDYVIHLGDTYYAGTAAECQASLDMWPLRDAQTQSRAIQKLCTQRQPRNVLRRTQLLRDTPTGVQAGRKLFQNSDGILAIHRAGYRLCRRMPQPPGSQGAVGLARRQSERQTSAFDNIPYAPSARVCSCARVFGFATVIRPMFRR